VEETLCPVCHGKVMLLDETVHCDACRASFPRQPPPSEATRYWAWVFGILLLFAVIGGTAFHPLVAVVILVAAFLIYICT